MTKPRAYLSIILPKQMVRERERERGEIMSKDDHLPLFGTKVAKGRNLFRCYVASVFVCIILICVYRVIHFPAAKEKLFRRWAWMGLFLSELWFSLYWFVSLSSRWNPICRYTFKDRLSQRYGKVLPAVDIFVCTADPRIEPPIMVINTVLSVMAYNYPSGNLSVYLSDDAASELTFCALLEASHFSKLWLPFCRKFNIEPRSPAAYFSSTPQPNDHNPLTQPEWFSVKNAYEDMKNRIESITKLGRISEDKRNEHEEFREWEYVTTPQNHPSIVQILIDGRNGKAMDVEGQPLPTLVYLAREKRPQYHHNFKAGAMNSLIRVSSKISNGPIILNVDCDIYSNNSELVRDALCFFMDEEKGREIAYVQFPQYYSNLTRNDLYDTYMRVVEAVEFPSMDALGGPCYIGTGCFHRRDILCGMKYSKECDRGWKRKNDGENRESVIVLEDSCKVLASCTYEENTQWGKEMGLKYDCAVEDIITGLSIQCRGWKSIFCRPERKSFLGVAPTTLFQALIQHKRWSEGWFQIFLSRHNPFVYGHKKIPLSLQFAYARCSMWALNCLPTLYYVAIPTICLLGSISLFPEISSLWILPFACLVVVEYSYSLGEFICCDGTIKGWWNEQRAWIYRRTTSYLFAFTDTILKLLGFVELSFAITEKVSDEDVSRIYEQEVMEFGSTSPMFTILATLAMLNLFSFIWGVLRMVLDVQVRELESLAIQLIQSGVLVLINLPLYQGLFSRKDMGAIPTSVTYKSVILALLACTVVLYRTS